MSAYSVCIPRIFSNIPNKKIVGTFEKLQLGKVDTLDVVWKTGRDGSSFKMVFIHFSEWNIHSSAAMKFKEDIENPLVEAKLVYDDPWYWIVLPNQSHAAANSRVSSRSMYRVDEIVDSVSNSNHMLERIAALEDEMSCIYEELYQREFLPVKYRTEYDLNRDIETGDTSTDPFRFSFPMNTESPAMTLAELELEPLHIGLGLGEMEIDTEFQTPPKQPVVHPYNECMYGYQTPQAKSYREVNEYIHGADAILAPMKLARLDSHNDSLSPTVYNVGRELLFNDDAADAWRPYDMECDNTNTNTNFVPLTHKSSKLWMTINCCDNL